jgi:hypothetical protein
MRRRIRALRAQVAELEIRLEMEEIKRRVMTTVYARSIEAMNELATRETPP